MGPNPTALVFPNWARLVLSLVIGAIGYIVASGVIHSDSAVAIGTALTALMASAGIVPASGKDFLAGISPTLRWLLTVVVTVAATIISLIDMDTTVRGIIVALLAFAASLGIVPPQTTVDIDDLRTTPRVPPGALK